MFRGFTMAAVLFFSAGVFFRAEANICPPGYYPIGGGTGGWTGCAPMPGGNSESPPDPGPQWASRWGAIYIDGTNGVFGTAQNMSSRARAKKAALKDCNKRGGKSCIYFGGVANQCQAFAVGDTQASGGVGARVEDATRQALAQCSSITVGCKITYSACSYPVRMR